ncbi:MAG: polysulfide reductase [Bacteroidetes bacterium 4572_77]|nr:MAG: polysulfide reductase [Bacteroidetes bacterium 4572_77]
MSESLSKEKAKKLVDKYAQDAIRPMKNHKGFWLWMGFLGLILILFGYAYFLQLRDGLGVTAMRDYVSWGLYIANFVFFVAASLVGMLISAVLGLLQQKWVKPITRVSEIIALGFVLIAGIVIITDMGRPERFLNLFIHGRLQSPIVWDVTVILTYTAISTLLFLLPLIPDLAFLKKRMKDMPKWQYNLYNILSLGWIGTPDQYKLLHKSIRMLSIIIVPVALSIHTVTSWLFAATLRPGWDTTIFGPYFVAGAFVAGAAAVIILMNILRSSFKLQDYFTDHHFDMMGRLLVLVSLLYAYFNVNEFLVPAYKMKSGEAVHLYSLFQGAYAGLFWAIQIIGMGLPIIFMMFKSWRKPGRLTFISVIVLIAAFIKRYIIVVPTLLHPYLPIQNVPEKFHEYFPTWIEISVTAGAFAMALIIITILLKIFPVIPMWELAEEEGITDEFEKHQ